MSKLSKAERHLSRASQLQADADDALREAVSYSFAGEPDENGNYEGDTEESRRMLAVHGKLLDRAQLHIDKATAILDNLSRNLVS